MKTVYRHSRIAICICTDCDTSVSVPDEAWPKAPGWSDEKRLP
jgi:hypothetical protein